MNYHSSAPLFDVTGFYKIFAVEDENLTLEVIPTWVFISAT
jgi:hypothetical protein